MMKMCHLPNCDEKFYAKGMCYGHYRSTWDYGTPFGARVARAIDNGWVRLTDGVESLVNDA